MASEEVELSVNSKDGATEVELSSLQVAKESSQNSSNADLAVKDGNDSPERPRDRRKSHTRGEGKWLKKHHESMRELEKRRSSRNLMGSSSSGRLNLSFHSLRSSRKLQHMLELANSQHSYDFKDNPYRETGDTHYRPREPFSSAVLHPSSSGDSEAQPRNLSGSAPGHDLNNNASEGEKERHASKGLTVSFSTCTIRYYETILGDNPFCSSGPSLSLGWDYDPSTVDADIPIDMIESIHSHHHKSEWDLMLSPTERERRLLDRGFSREHIAQAVAESNRIKNQRRQTILNLRVSRAEEMFELFSRRSKKALRIRKGSSHLFNEWQQGTYKAPTESPKQAKKAKKQRDIGNHNSIVQQATTESREVVKAEKDTCSNSGSAIKGNKNNTFGISYVSPLEILESMDDEKDSKEKEPFAVIDCVFSGSPADEAGFKKGDLLIQFGSVSRENNKNLTLVGELACIAFSKEKRIPVVLLRNGSTSELGILPRSWEGRGYLGFLLKPFKLKTKDKNE